jgi:hypothetical protein
LLESSLPVRRLGISQPFPHIISLPLIIWHLFWCISRYKQKGITVVSCHISLSCMFVYCRNKFIMAHASPLLS